MNRRIKYQDCMLPTFCPIHKMTSFTLAKYKRRRVHFAPATRGSGVCVSDWNKEKIQAITTMVKDLPGYLTCRFWGKNLGLEGLRS